MLEIRKPELNDEMRRGSWYPVIWDSTGYETNLVDVLLYREDSAVETLVLNIAEDIFNKGYVKFFVPFNLDIFDQYFIRINIKASGGGVIDSIDSQFFGVIAKKSITDFDDIIDFKKKILVEIQAGRQIYSTDWVSLTGTNVFYIPYTGKEIVEMKSDDTVMTRCLSVTECEAIENSYYHDIENQVLYVNMSGSPSGDELMPNPSLEDWTAVVGTDNLIYYYTMDNISGASLVDEMGNSDGTISGAVPAAGYINNALSFDGTDDYVDLNFQIGGYSAFTFMMWVKSSAISDGQRLCGLIDSSSRPFTVYARIDAGGLTYVRFRGIIGGVTLNVNKLFTLADSDWHFVVIRYDGTNASVDVDMTGWANTAATGSTFAIALDMFLGANNENGTPLRHFSGLIDNFRFFDAALTDDELTVFFGEKQKGILPDYYDIDFEGVSGILQNDTEVHESTYSAELFVDADNSSVEFYSDPVELLVNDQYNFSFFYMMSDSAKTWKYQIRDSGGSIYLQADGSWDTVQYWFDIPNQTGTFIEIDQRFVTNPSFQNYVFAITNNSAASSSIYIDLLSLINTNPATTLLMAMQWLCFTNSQEHDDLLSFVPQNAIYNDYYLPLINTNDIPQLSQKVGRLYNTQVAIQFGNINFLNNGLWWEYKQVYDLHNKNIVVKIGEKNADYDEYVTVYIGITKTPVFSDNLVSITVNDSRNADFIKIPNLRFDLTTYPNMDTKFENKIIPVLFGEVSGITPILIDSATRKYKISQTVFNGDTYELEEIIEVYDNGVAAAFTGDEANGEFTLTNPATGTITCDARGLQCSFSKSGSFEYLPDYTYSENASDILYFILTILNGINPDKIDIDSFAAFKTKRNQKMALYLDSFQNTSEIIRNFQTSTIAFLIPDLDNRYFIQVYDRTISEESIKMTDYDYQGFQMSELTEEAYKEVVLKYDKNPSTGIYKEINVENETTQYVHNISSTLELLTYLKDDAEAASFANFYSELIQNPSNIVSVNLPPTVLDYIPGDRLDLSRTITDGNGNEIVILESEIYAILETRKNINNGRVDVIAILDSQAGGTPEHADTPHVDEYIDLPYVDHSNFHSDAEHADVDHVDTAHGNSHSDTHSQTAYIQNHSDIAHTDIQGEHTDTTYNFHSDHSDGVGFHQDFTHSDYQDHDDGYTDSDHSNVHQDIAYVDEHSNFHTDTEYIDTDHVDGDHSNSYTDHEDGPYTDTHANEAHIDSEI